jgi:hypothetical protein
VSCPNSKTECDPRERPRNPCRYDPEAYVTHTRAHISEKELRRLGGSRANHDIALNLSRQEIKRSLLVHFNMQLTRV